MKTIEVKCVFCGGTGKRKKSVFTKKEKAKARKLRKEGLTLRAIGKEMGGIHQQIVKDKLLS